MYYLRDLRGKAAKIREKRDGVEGYGDGILSTPVAEVVAAPVEQEVVAEPVALAQEVVAQPAEAVAQDAVEASAEVAQADEQSSDAQAVASSDEEPKA
ncbi:unannotated protein [freshwater metagenome]|uniref:Unannotated protein n=1 Tax=freshwater metagenome TaxID=449393 RepID=A0A6J6DKC2_9ZZZZ